MKRRDDWERAAATAAASTVLHSLRCAAPAEARGVRRRARPWRYDGSTAAGGEPASGPDAPLGLRTPTRHREPSARRLPGPPRAPVARLRLPRSRPAALRRASFTRRAGVGRGAGKGKIRGCRDSPYPCCRDQALAGESRATTRPGVFNAFFPGAGTGLGDTRLLEERIDPRRRDLSSELAPGSERIRFRATFGDEGHHSESLTITNS